MTVRRAGFVVALAFVLYGVFLASVAHMASSPAPDFPNYYYSATNLAGGTSIYTDPEAQIEADFGIVDPEIQYFADPPPVAVLFYPLQFLSYETAWWVLIVLSAIAMMATVWVTGRQLGMAPPVIVAIAAASLLTTGFRYHTYTNHFEVVLALLAALGWVRLHQRGSPGVYWGLAAALKLFPALWTAAFIRSRRIVLAGSGTFAAVMAGAVMIVGWADFGRFVRDIVPASVQWYGATGNYSLMSMGFLVGGVRWGWAFAGTGLIGAIWTTHKYRASSDALYVSAVAWSLLLSPLSWLNYLVVAVSPLMVIGRRVDWSDRREMYPGLVMGVGLLMLGPILVFDATWLNIAVTRIPTVSLLLLAVWAPRLIARGGPKM